jgi:sensor histidine kinase YesM
MFNGKRVSLEESNGIGLNNTRRRLDLLYPDHYKLLVNKNTDEHEFHVQLTVDLS